MDAVGIDFTDSGEPVAEASSIALADMDKPDPEALARLCQILRARGIKTREGISLTDGLTFLFYDTLSLIWTSRTAERQARKRMRRREAARAQKTGAT